MAGFDLFETGFLAKIDEVVAEKCQAKGRILLIEDDADVRKTYARMLRRFGYFTDTAKDGAEAIERLQTDYFDVIVSDISMPGMSGIDLLRAIRQQNLAIPVILMTGAPNMESAVEAVEYGALKYLIKPVDFTKLNETIQQAISSHHMAELRQEALKLMTNKGKMLDNRASLEARFNYALERLWIAFQPIVLWKRHRVFAYEALVRTEESSLQLPPDLLEAAERLERLPELSRAIRAAVARASELAPERVLLFVNLHAADLDDPELFSLDAPLSPIASRVVLEITEHVALGGSKELGVKIARLRSMGFRVAVDDLGSGYAGLATFAQLEPDFVKLDMSLVRGVDASSSRRSVIRAMVMLCSELGIQVISEGVETPPERDALLLEGCELLQGYLFAKPNREFVRPNW